METLRKKYRLTVVGLATNSEREIRRYTKRRKIRWTQISLLEHPEIQSMYPIDALPRYVLLDSEGVLLYMGTMKGLQEELERL